MDSQADASHVCTVVYSADVSVKITGYIGDIQFHYILNFML